MDRFDIGLSFIYGPGRDGDPFHITAHDVNPTSFGITFATWVAWQRVHHAPAFMNDFKSASRDSFSPIYLTWYWNSCRCYELPHGVDTFLFDASVLSGVKRATSLLQKSVNVPADGAFGPITMSAVQAMSAVDLINGLTVERLEYYESLANAGYFDGGWKQRTLDGCQYAISACDAAAAVKGP